MPLRNSTEHPTVLLLGQQDRDIDFSWLYQYLGEFNNVQVETLAKPAIKQLPKTLRQLNYRQFDRIILDLPFAKVHRFSRFLQTIPGLIIYEEDACQNFLESSRWHGAFERYYTSLPTARIIVTGHSTSAKLRALGIPTKAISKGFDQSILTNQHKQRDIEVGFIGRTRSAVYEGRRRLLESVDAQLGVSLLRTQTPTEYNQTLNRIKFFLSADIGIGEHMAKNFEAMACGCVVVANAQGDETELGLIDMENIVLYRTAEEAIDKIKLLQRDDQRAAAIAAAGETLVLNHYTHKHIADQLIAIVRGPVTSAEARRPGWLERLWRG